MYMYVSLQGVMEGYVLGAKVAPQPPGSTPLMAPRPATIRPLTAVYQASSGSNQVGSSLSRVG